MLNLKGLYQKISWRGDEPSAHCAMALSPSAHTEGSAKKDLIILDIDVKKLFGNYILRYFAGEIIYRLIPE